MVLLRLLRLLALALERRGHLSALAEAHNRLEAGGVRLAADDTTLVLHKILLRKATGRVLGRTIPY